MRNRPKKKSRFENHFNMFFNKLKRISVSKDAVQK